ncbi:DUF7310 family coiled-coil domain-containing protein [Natranaeroarchaeum sulfidigenes]|uniref:Putative pilin/flagellin, contains class III signal peptide n=1 Tax=Natranaeroarchaeum sulfidigenes TaxID=2784880 RepID=A0A897N070_9EURY|nr:hypothetical protein [Natranaeroarchaeum sulfidigenes]QSG03756.1 putative pilin/flagellin, contains class III signal peptide [Natranaeroarchaeum sulfidigenes]
MTDLDTVDERLRAVERAISDGDADNVVLADPDGELTERIETLEGNVAELDAAVQAIRGYVGHIRSLDESVEQEADSALAAVDDLRERVDRLEADGLTEDRPPAPSTDPPSSAASYPGREHDRATTPRERTSTDGGTANQEYNERHTQRRELHPASAGACPCCGSPRDSGSHRHSQPSKAPGSEQAAESGSARNRPDRGEAPSTDTPPVEKVDEDGLVDRLRGKL